MAILAWLAGNRVALIALLGALVVAVALNGVYALRLAHEQRDHAQDRAAWAEQVAKAERKGREDTEAAKVEGERRFTEQEKITNVANEQAKTAALAAAGAAAAGDKLQERVRQLTRALSAAANNPPPVSGSIPTSSPGDLLALMFSRLGEAENGIAGFADSAHIAGNACQAEYDSLNHPGTTGSGDRQSITSFVSTALLLVPVATTSASSSAVVSLVR